MVYYLHEWAYPDPEMQNTYAKLQAEFPAGVLQVDTEDPEAVWAVSTLRSG